jgi:hypothetical protein
MRNTTAGYGNGRNGTLDLIQNSNGHSGLVIDSDRHLSVQEDAGIKVNVALMGFEYVPQGGSILKHVAWNSVLKQIQEDEYSGLYKDTR